MMKNLNDAENLGLLNELKEVMDKCSACDAVATLKRFVQRSDGDMNHIDLQQTVCRVSNSIYLNENYIYVTMSTESTAELKRIKAMWETMLKRGTQNMLDSKANDYALVIDLIETELERNLAYTLSFFQPVFASLEDDSLMLVFALDNMYFGKEVITLDEIEYMESDTYETEANDKGIYDETDEFISTEDYLKL